MSHTTFATLLLLSPAALAQSTSEAGASKPAPSAATAPSLGSSLQQDLEARLAALEKQVADQKVAREAAEKAAKSKWYEKLSLRGYTQFRTTTLFNRDLSPNLVVPNDPSVSETDTLNIRRGRITLSGDVSDHVSLYAQLDFYGSVGGSGDKGLQSRDLYADIYLDDAKEYRFRAGLSKVPFGWVNLQSSGNRAPMERPDAINSAAEGERDFGLYFYWAPKEIRELFKHLVKSGLKGSGDYGVVGVGAYSGQGPNRSDLNGDVHWAARLAYPFRFGEKQIAEVAIQGYTGDFVVGTQAIAGTTPTVDSQGVDDERVGVTAVLYPQPFGFEAEWNWGVGPELNSALTTINSESLQGGYLQANYLLETSKGNVFPFARWNYFDGARKFAKNAPWDQVNELDLGFEWSPWPELEVSVMYTYTFERTDTTDVSGTAYEKAQDDQRIGFQLQWNY